MVNLREGSTEITNLSTSPVHLNALTKRQSTPPPSKYSELPTRIHIPGFTTLY